MHLLYFILISGELSLILTHLRMFCIWPVVLVFILVMFKSMPRFHWGPALSILPIIIIFFQPYQYMDGGWDPGAYINTGVHIAQTGSIVYHDEMIKKTAGVLRQDGTGLKYPGLYVKDADKGLVVPQFFHLYPVWIAIFYKLFGLKGVFYVNPFFALLNVTLLYRIGKKIMGKRYGILSVLLLGLNVIEIWNARFSISEILGQFLLLTGFYFLLEDNKSSLFWAGVSLGEFLLVNITSILIIPVLIIYLVSRLNKKDIYFIIPFLLLFIHLVIQISAYSSIYLENIMMFFQKKEIYFLFAVFPVFLVLYKTMLNRLAFALPLFFVYGYFIRPRISSDVEALNLVELGNCLSLVGLIFSVLGLMAVIHREKNKGLILFIITALVYVVFFLYDKRMNTRYPFSFRRYSAVVIPAYCLSISYLVYFLKGRLKFLSILFMPLIITIPVIRNKDVVLVKDHNSWLRFWTDFSENMDNNSLYISNSYRWARPLTDIFGKKAIAYKDFIEEGDYYITDGNQPYSLSKDFIEVYRKSYNGNYLEHSMTYPPRVRKVELSLKIYKITEIGPLDKDEYLIDIGEEDIGLLAGFDKARGFSGIEGTARWTFNETRLVIPWFGDNVNQELTIMAGGRLEEAGDSVISLYINNRLIISNYRIGEEIKGYSFHIPAGAVDTGNSKRVVLTITANPWSPSQYGIDGFPNGLGVLLNWVKISRVFKV